MNEENKKSIEEQVKEAVEELRPFIQNDGGDLEFLGMEGKKVKVRLVGSCKTCPHAIYTLQFGVEAHLKEKIPEIEGIIRVE